jgi:hypothetical protein
MWLCSSLAVFVPPPLPPLPVTLQPPPPLPLLPLRQVGLWTKQNSAYFQSGAFHGLPTTLAVAQDMQTHLDQRNSYHWSGLLSVPPAESFNNTVEGNIMYNGPRAGINFNDGMGGGSKGAPTASAVCRLSGSSVPSAVIFAPPTVPAAR